MWDLIKSYWNSVPNTGQTIIIGVISALVTMFAVDPIRRKRDKLWEAKDKREKEEADRKNYHKNVVRQGRNEGTRFGSASITVYAINPSWIIVEEEENLLPGVKGGNHLALMFTNFAGGYMPRAEIVDEVEKAIKRHEWLVFTVDSDGFDTGDTILEFRSRIACNAEESHLFGDMPVQKKLIDKKKGEKPKPLPPGS